MLAEVLVDRAQDLALEIRRTTATAVQYLATLDTFLCFRFFLLLMREINTYVFFILDR